MASRPELIEATERAIGGDWDGAHATVQDGTSAVCRIYIVPDLGDSHFYGRDAAECAATLAARLDAHGDEAGREVIA